MKELTFEKMERIEGGFNWGCALGVAGYAASFVGISLIATPAAAAVWAVTHTLASGSMVYACVT
jgi:hypothetical protein